MPYVIQAIDKADSLELRNELRGQHLEYLKTYESQLLAGGALIEDDGTGGSGSIIILDTEDRTEADAFAAGDPFNQGGLFESVSVTRWRKVFFDGKCLI